MRIESIRIANFRGVADAELHLDEKLTVLIGANNAGKTTVLDALAAVLTYRRGAAIFQDADFRAVETGADVRTAKAIELTVRIGPTRSSKFEPGELGALAPDTKDGVEFVRLRLRAEYSKELRQVEAVLVRLNPEGQPHDREGFGSFPWRDQLLFRAFGSDRDLQRGMGGRWSDWSRLLGQVRPSSEVLENVTTLFQAGSEFLVEGTPELGEIGQALRPVGDALGMPGADVKLTVTPQDPADLLQNVFVEMRLAGAPRGFRAERHGHGTQGALLFALYRLQTEWELKRPPAGASALLTVEEPESHLHPTAQRAMAREISRLPGQVVVTSHSPEFVEHGEGSLALLRSVGGKTTIQGVDSTDRSLRDHPRAAFARCVIVTEGLEAGMLPYFSRALDIDLGSCGIEVVNAGGGKSIPRLWKTFGKPGLGIPVVCIADGDDDQAMELFLKAMPDGVDIPKKRERFPAVLQQYDYFTCSYSERLEQELAACAPDHIKRIFPELAKSGVAFLDEGEDDVDALARRLSQSKKDVVRVARLMTKNGTDPALIPPRFRDALKRAEKLARGDHGTTSEG